jgi:hypothetical protein
VLCGGNGPRRMRSECSHPLDHPVSYLSHPELALSTETCFVASHPPKSEALKVGGTEEFDTEKKSKRNLHTAVVRSKGFTALVPILRKLESLIEQLGLS